MWIGVAYLAPDISSDVSTIDRHLSAVNTVTSAMRYGDVHVLLGDYNQPHLCWKRAPTGVVILDAEKSTFNTASSKFVDGMSFNNMRQLNTVTNVRDRTLDLLFINEDASTHCSVFEELDSYVSTDLYHPALVAVLKISLPCKFVDAAEVNRYNFNKADIASLNIAYENIDWTQIESMNDIDLAVSFFNQTVTSMFEQYIPVVQPRCKHTYVA